MCKASSSVLVSPVSFEAPQLLSSMATQDPPRSPPLKPMAKPAWLKNNKGSGKGLSSLSELTADIFDGSPIDCHLEPIGFDPADFNIRLPPSTLGELASNKRHKASISPTDPEPPARGRPEPTTCSARTCVVGETGFDKSDADWRDALEDEMVETASPSSFRRTSSIKEEVFFPPVFEEKSVRFHDSSDLAGEERSKRYRDPSPHPREAPLPLWCWDTTDSTDPELAAELPGGTLSSYVWSHVKRGRSPPALRQEGTASRRKSDPEAHVHFDSGTNLNKEISTRLRSPSPKRFGPEEECDCPVPSPANAPVTPLLESFGFSSCMQASLLVNRGAGFTAL
mmetsp:Transcript_31481/g.49283  ORF Transcript_31481/g.49283 Transcript_31481/m.49283 type:complete len:339 (+) Transcript_31481:257-1273(+)